MRSHHQSYINLCPKKFSTMQIYSIKDRWYNSEYKGCSIIYEMIENCFACFYKAKLESWLVG